MPPTRNLSEIFIQTLEQAVDSVVVIDSHNRVVLFNRAAEQFWGLERNQSDWRQRQPTGAP